MYLLKNFNRPHVGVYVLLASCICFIGATILAFSQIYLIDFLKIENLHGVNFTFDDWSKGEGITPSLFELTVSGPIFETMLLIILLFLLTKFLSNRLIICCVSAVIWGVAHAVINSPVNGLPSAWIFFVLSSSIFDWDDDASKQYFVPLGIHSLVNALAYFLL
jgi:hypothetical protein